MQNLPILDVIPELKKALAARDEIVLEAPPGAGKTTCVPLQLLDARWLGERKILMLEPRRIAARMAAARMAELLGEAVGETVGYRVRLDSKVGPSTRIEIVTEGLLIRYLQEDPSLADVGLLIFDEFHERSLDADLGLALALQGRSLFRDVEPLKLLVMSATLDGDAVSELLNKAPVIRSRGRQYPVDVIYTDAFNPQDDLVVSAYSKLRKILNRESGSVLVFLPGQAEIRRLADLLEPGLKDYPDIQLQQLHGSMDLAAQRQAIEVAPAGFRKLVLATNIAETSLTIEGVRVVVDAGLSRQPVFDPAKGLVRLQTRRVSRASADQRAGRAGRMEPGVCYRLWSNAQQAELLDQADPEIRQTDLAPMALELLQWGISDPYELTWIDDPPKGAWDQALSLLGRLGAVEACENLEHRLTAHGRQMVQLPLHPRLGHMLLVANSCGLKSQAAVLAALLEERDFLKGAGADIDLRLSAIKSTGRTLVSKNAQHRISQLARRYERQCTEPVGSAVSNPKHSYWTGYLLALAYPDRIARQQEKNTQNYQLSNGRMARLWEADPLQGSPWLVVANMGGRKGQGSDQIFLAADLDPALFGAELQVLVSAEEIVEFDKKTEKVLTEKRRRVGSLVLERKPFASASQESINRILVEYIRDRGIQILPWSKPALQLRARIGFLRKCDEGSGIVWPDVSDQGLSANLEQWLEPSLNNSRQPKDLAKLDTLKLILAMLPWAMRSRLDEMAPEKLVVPSGSNIRLDYDQYPPVLSVALQEMFGCMKSPAVLGGQVALKVELLSPARRPLQVTQDMAGFWEGSYAEVRKEMKGRYPKHHWPENPLLAEPTTRAKRKPR